MSNFLRLVNNNIEDFFVYQAEGIRYCIDEFLQDPPYLLSHGYLNSFLGYLAEYFPDCLIIGKSSGYGEKVVLDGTYGGSCYLGGKTPALAFAESKISLAVLEELMESFP